MRIKAVFFALCLVVFAGAASAQDHRVVELAPPAGFTGPTRADLGPGAHTEGYVRKIPGTERGTLIQISTYDFGEKLRAIPMSELGNAAEHYVMQMLQGIERARSKFHADTPTRTVLAGLPGARVEWSGEAQGERMSGVMYCVVDGSVVVTLHTQGFHDSPPADRADALHAIEHISLRAER